MSTNTTVVPQSFYAVTLGVDDVASQRAFYEQWGWQAKPYSTAEYVASTFKGPSLLSLKRGSLALRLRRARRSLRAAGKASRWR